MLRRALSHRSWVAEQPDAESNERLEFLGDAVLGFVIADLVFERFSDLAEGSLTDLRKAVVNQRALAEVARSLGLGEHIYLGRGEGAAGGGDKDSILADAFEAVLG
ncbi:MAG: ribonuclease III domain-containing protein, partial [Ilumatobacter sp.]